MSLLNFYYHLPYPLRVAVASARGYTLRRWRYSGETERLVEEALERETWPREKIVSWQQEKLAEALDHAARQTPYYRNFWSERRKHGDKRSWADLSNWPVLKKSTVREQPRAFLADDYRGKHLYEEHTSGTTGTPLTIWQSREALIAWYALFEARWRRWNGVSCRSRWAIIGGQPVASVKASRPPYWVWNHAFSQLYLSSYHLSPRTVRDYINAIADSRVEYMYAYPSAMFQLAELAIGAGVNAPRLKIALSNAEALFEYQTQSIGEVFQCEVKNTYGMSELVCAASECSAGSLHLWPEAGITELLDIRFDEPPPPGSSGRIVATGFLNPAMPLIRYEVGDEGSISKSACPCGRSMAVLASIDGRSDDIIHTPDGRRIGRLDPVFKANMPILEAQIIQETLENITVQYVPAMGFHSIHLRELDQRLHDRLGDMNIAYLPVERIPKGPNGKFRAVISNLR